MDLLCPLSGALYVHGAVDSRLGLMRGRQRGLQRSARRRCHPARPCACRERRRSTAHRAQRYRSLLRAHVIIRGLVQTYNVKRFYARNENRNDRQGRADADSASSARRSRLAPPFISRTRDRSRTRRAMSATPSYVFGTRGFLIRNVNNRTLRKRIFMHTYVPYRYALRNA